MPFGSELRHRLNLHIAGMPALPPQKQQRASSAAPPVRVHGGLEAPTKPAPGPRLAQAAFTQSTGALGLDHLPDEVRSALWPSTKQRSPSHEPQKLGTVNVPTLAFKLSDAGWRERRDAAQNLRGAGKDSEIVLPKLAMSLEDNNGKVRSAAADTLANLGAQLGGDGSKLIGFEAVKRLADEDLAVRRAAQKPVDTLLAASGAEDFSTLAAPATADFVDKLKSDSWRTREHTAKAMGKLGIAGVPVVAELAKLYADEAYSVRAAAKYAIAEIYSSGAIFDLGATAAPSVPALTQRLTHRDWRVRAAAAHGLGVFGGSSVAGVAELTMISVDETASPNARLLAISTLGDLGTLSMPAVVELASLTDDKNPHICEVATRAVEAIHDACQAFCPSSIPQRSSKRGAEKFDDPSPEVRELAIESLMKDGVLSAPATLNLMASVSDTDLSVRHRTKEALERLRTLGVFVNIMTCGAQVVSSLVEALQDSAWQVRSAALEALSFLLAVGAEPLQRLSSAVQDDSRDASTKKDVETLLARLSLSGALVDRTKAVSAIAPHLVEQLADESPSTHSVAREALSKFLMFDKKLVHSHLVKSVLVIMEEASTASTSEGREKAARKLQSLENVLAPAIDEASKRRQKLPPKQQQPQQESSAGPSIADEERGLREALADAATSISRARLLGVAVDGLMAVERRLQKCSALGIDNDLLVWAEAEYERLREEADTIQIVVDRPRSSDSKASRLSNESQLSRASRNSFQRGPKRPPSDEGATIWRAIFNSLEKSDYGQTTRSRLQIAYEAYERDDRGYLEVEDVKAAMQDCSMALMYVCIRRLQLLQLWQLKQQVRVDLLDEQVVWCTEELSRLQNSAEGHIPKDVVKRFARRLGADDNLRIYKEAFMEQALAGFFDGLPKPILVDRLTSSEQTAVQQAFQALDVRRKAKVAAADVMMSLQLAGFRSRFGAFAGVEMELIGVVLSPTPFMDYAQFQALLCRHNLLHLGESMAIVARLERAIAWSNKEELQSCLQKAQGLNIPEHLIKESKTALARIQERKTEGKSEKDKEKSMKQQLWRLLFGKVERGDKDIGHPTEVENLYRIYDPDARGRLLMEDVGFMVRDCSKSLSSLCAKRLAMMEDWWNECQERERRAGSSSLEAATLSADARRLRQQVSWCREQLAGFKQTASEGIPVELLKDTCAKLGSIDGGQSVTKEAFMVNAMNVFYEGAVVPQDQTAVTEAQMLMLKGIFDKLGEAGTKPVTSGAVLDWLTSKGFRSAFGAFSGIELELLWRHQHKHEIQDLTQFVEVLCRHSVLPLLVG